MYFDGYKSEDAIPIHPLTGFVIKDVVYLICMNKLLIAVGVFVLIVIAAILLIVIPAPKTAVAPTDGVATTSPASIPDLIVVTTPLPQAKVSSPLTVSGEARGNWYFEASAPYLLKDASGAVIAQGHIDAQGDWMTTNFVPFTATLTFPSQPAGSSGTLILKNDNPSGDPSKQKELDISVQF